MAEFCLKCWNELNGIEWTDEDCTVAYDYVTLCEGCARMRHVIVDYRRPSWVRRMWRRRRKWRARHQYD